MADTFSTAKLGLGVDTKQFNKEIDKTSTTTERALASMKLSADSFSEKWDEMTAGIKDTKRIISGILVSQAFYTVSQGLVRAASSALDFSKNMETAAISMEYFVEGADKAAKAAAYLRTMNTFAARTPFTTEETLSLSKYMQAVGVSMNTTKSFLSVITDTAAATGATEENLQRIVFGLGQMMTKGRLANEEIRQLANANIPIYEILQEELGLTGKEISNIGKNWVSADKAVVAILNGLEKRYDGAADRIADTVTGMTDTILDNAKIIAQIAGSGIYDALAEKMGTVRDALDRYREIATAEGSMGLFNQILKDIDSSGEIGTMLLALIGNTRQLGAAIRETYISAKPLVDLFGKSLYASVTVAEITITSFSQIVNSLVKGLNKLGITSGTTAEVISSLFIAYKAAKWMAFLGEGATAAAYSLYQSVSAASALLPASLQASAGVKLLSSSLIGLATYGLAAFGVFKMLNSAMAGLDISKSTGNLFPDDYTEAMRKYQEEMEAYNKKVAEYQKDFESPYNEISDGSGTAVDGLEAVSDASKKAAASVKSDWTAAFDEVYSIPDQNSGTGGSGDAPVPPDFGSLLTLPSFNFPDLSEVELKMPDFPWSDVFDNGLLDSDVLDGDWWKSLLPFVIGGGAIQLGKILASNNKNLSDTLDTAAKNVTETILANKAAQKAAFTTLANSYDDVETLLSKTLAELRNPKLSNEARELLERNLSKLVDSGQKTVDQLNEVQDALLLTGSARKSTAVFDLAKQQDALNKINSSLSHIEELNLKLSDAAFAQTTAGHASLQELKQLKEATIKQYVGYAGDYGSDEVIEGMAKQLGLDIPNLSNSIEAVRGKLLELISIAEDGFSDVARAQGLLKETKGLLSHIAEDSSMLGLHVKGIDALQAQLSILNDGLKATTKASLDKELLTAVRNVLNNKDALNELKLLNSTTTMHLEELSTKYAEGFVKNQKISKAVSDIAITFDDVRMSAISLQQTQINMNKLFARNIDNLVNRQIPTIMGQLGSVDKYGADLLRQTVEGRNLLTKLDKNVEVAIGSITKETEALRKPLEEIRQVTKGLVSSNMKTSGLVTKHYGEIADAIVEIGSASKANAEAVDKALDTFSSLVETGISKSTVSGVETAIKQLGISATAKPNTALPADPFTKQSDELWARLLQRSKTAEEFERNLDEGLDKIIRELAKRNNADPLVLFDKYADRVDEMLNGAKEAFKYNAGGGAGLLDSKITKADFEKAITKIGAEIADVPAAQADAIGKGIRSEAVFLLDQLEASQSAEWKNFVKVLVKVESLM
jgi:tape measure domain-containing protein